MKEDQEDKNVEVEALKETEESANFEWNGLTKEEIEGFITSTSISIRREPFLFSDANPVFVQELLSKFSKEGFSKEMKDLGYNFSQVDGVPQLLEYLQADFLPRPTNDADIDTLFDLVESLEDFKGIYIFLHKVHCLRNVISFELRTLCKTDTNCSDIPAIQILYLREDRLRELIDREILELKEKI